MAEKITKKNTKDNLNQKYTELQYMEQHLQTLNSQFEQMEERYLEISTLKASIDELSSADKDSEVLVPISNGIFLKAKIEKKDLFLVNAGSNIVVEKNAKSTIELLTEQSEQIANYRNNIYEQIQNITSQMRLIEDEIATLQKSF
jgi:prefoldin alpha subunit